MSERTERRRSPRVAAALLLVVFTTACESSTVSGLNIRAAPTTSSAIVGRLGSAGTSVYIDCYTRGQSIYGQTVWYRISQPRRGYVTAYYVRTDRNTLGASQAC